MGWSHLWEGPAAECIGSGGTWIDDVCVVFRCHPRNARVVAEIEDVARARGWAVEVILDETMPQHVLVREDVASCVCEGCDGEE